MYQPQYTARNSILSVPAITVTPTDLFLILQRYTRVLNRHWSPEKSAIGSRLLLHAHPSVQDDKFQRLLTGPLSNRDRTQLIEFLTLTGRFLASARITGLILDHQVTTALHTERYHPSSDPWFRGPNGIILDEVRPLDVNPRHRGNIGIWRWPVPGGMKIAIATHFLERENR